MTEDVLFSTDGFLGVITLNRPQALNALTLPMIMDMQHQLISWQHDDAIHAVIVQAAPGKAFCAGGDVRWLYHMGQEDREQQMSFFWHEYRLNYYIHTFDKPYIALMDGITMGGGAGISLHGSHTIASERFVFAMPETSIGFFPDIGSSYFLNKTPGSLGMYLGLTGNSLGAVDAEKAGLVQAVIPSHSMQDFVAALKQIDLTYGAFDKVTECMTGFSVKKDGAFLSDIGTVVESCFSKASILTIMDALSTCDEEQAGLLYKQLSDKCPLSLMLTFEQLQRTKGLSLAECLAIDFTLVNHCMHDANFYEGVRALLIDKDKKPVWKPRVLHEVSAQTIQAYFEQTNVPLKFIMP